MCKCYVCGKPIDKQYYSFGTDIKICMNDDCFFKYYWQTVADRILNNKYHEYAIIDNKVYRIGNENDEPQGCGGKFYAIRFNDGFYKETTSLWFVGVLPDYLKDTIKDNATFNF